MLHIPVLVPDRAEIWTQVCKHEYKSTEDGCCRDPRWLRDWDKGAHSDKFEKGGQLVEQVISREILGCRVQFWEGQRNAGAWAQA